jgi:hypothetical protein
MPGMVQIRQSGWAETDRLEDWVETNDLIWLFFLENSTIKSRA